MLTKIKKPIAILSALLFTSLVYASTVQPVIIVRNLSNPGSNIQAQFHIFAADGSFQAIPGYSNLTNGLNIPPAASTSSKNNIAQGVYGGNQLYFYVSSYGYRATGTTPYFYAGYKLIKQTNGSLPYILEPLSFATKYTQEPNGTGSYMPNYANNTQYVKTTYHIASGLELIKVCIYSKNSTISRCS